MRLIEFAIEKDPTEFSPYVILLDSASIIGLEQILNVKNKCRLLTKNKDYIVYGTYRTLTNRFYYALDKKFNFHEDDTIRPSLRVFHRHKLLECDPAFFDITQLRAFIYGLDPSFDKSNLPEYTQQLFKENNF